MSTKMILATFVGAIVAFFLGWFIYGMALKPYYEAHTLDYPGLQRGENMKIWGFFLAYLAWAGLLAYIFDRWANIRSFGPGFVGGFIIFFLSSLGYDLSMWSQFRLMDYQGIIVDVIVSGIFGGIIGGVIGAVLGTGKKSNA